MSVDTGRLFDLLPALYRLRDAELAAGMTLLAPAEGADLLDLEDRIATIDDEERTRLEGLRRKAARGPLGALLALFEAQLRVVEDDIEQLYDDSFVETASAWALPYLGDLIGYRSVSGRAPSVSARAEIGHTIAYRRRKGTASMLEQLARDVTGWDARVVESFALLGTTQSMNHRRLHNRVTPAMRDGTGLQWVGSAFDAVPRTLDVRRIGQGAGLHNLPNIAVFLWRIGAQAARRSRLTPDPTDASNRRFRFSPLGDDTALWTRPVREDEIEHLAEPANVPAPISLRRLHEDLFPAVADASGLLPASSLYGSERSLALFIGGMEVPIAELAVCNLADTATGWAHEAPAGKIAVDPTRGRLAVAADLQPLAGELTATFHRGGHDGLGGGTYGRATSFATGVTGLVVSVPDDHATIQGAIDDATAQGGGTVEIRNSGRYREALHIDIPAGASLEVRAADEVRPTVELTAEWTVKGGAGSRVYLNGLLVAGHRLLVPAGSNALAELHVSHCTFVPGRSLRPDGTPAQPGASSIAVRAIGVRLAICASILGALRAVDGTSTAVDGSIVDAGIEGTAFAAMDSALTTTGGDLQVESGTFIGSTRVRRLDASNAILFGRVEAARHQQGCVRFSFVGPGSRTPPRYRCQPGDGPAAANVPHFASLRFGAPAFARLADGTTEAVARGSEDESEMGVYRRRYEPQRHADLAARLDEYLRVGLQAGVMHES